MVIDAFEKISPFDVILLTNFLLTKMQKTKISKF